MGTKLTETRKVFFSVGKLQIYRSHLSDYMHRWILATPWGSVRVHHILRSDPDRDFHDHPFDFVSVILRSGYKEYVPDGTHRYRAGNIVMHKAEDLHRLELDAPAWTFVVTGPLRRNWGFQTPGGWVPWQSYDKVV